MVFNGLWTSHYILWNSPVSFTVTAKLLSQEFKHALYSYNSQLLRQFISCFPLPLNNCGTIFVMVCKLCKSYTLAIFKADILCIAYLIPLEIDVLHGINSHQLIKLITFVIGQPHNCNCWQPGNFSVLKKCNGKVYCLIFEMIFMKDVKPEHTIGLCTKLFILTCFNMHARLVDYEHYIYVTYLFLTLHTL